jgi:hypothetical protein
MNTPIILSIDASIPEIYETLNSLKTQYTNIGYISYIEGEYGLRAVIYNSMVREFVNKQKELKNIIVGLCFKSNTYFLKDICDIIIELNSTKLSKDYYSGNDGTNLFYNRGTYSEPYETMITCLELTNIFNTTRSDGLRLFDNMNNFTDIRESNNKIFGLIDNKPFMCSGSYHYMVDMTVEIYNKKKLELKNKNDNIMIFIRNTSKHTHRNINKDIYEGLFQYCIDNKKHLYVCLDLIPVTLPENEFIHNCNIREDGVLLIDTIIDICNKCYIYIGADSGITEICNLYTSTNILCTQKSFLLKKINNNPEICNSNDLISTLNNVYKSSIEII